VSISIFCDLLLYPSMQVPSFKYVVPRVLVVICAKFGKFPRIDPCVLDSFACKVAQDQTYLVSDQTCLARARHIQPMDRIYPALLVCLALETVNYSLIFHMTLTTCFLAFLSCSHSCTYSFLKAWLVKMKKGAPSTVKMSVALLVVLPQPRARNLPRDQDPAITRRSPPMRPLHLVEVLPMRQSS
jgi:hypothetical protein